MKKTLIASLICLGVSAPAFADNYFTYSPNATGTLAPENAYTGVTYAQSQYNNPSDRNTPYNPNYHKQIPPDVVNNQVYNTQNNSNSYVRAYNNEQYGIEVKIEVNDRLAKVYNIPTDQAHKFIIINGEEVPYLQGYDWYKEGRHKYSQPNYGVVHNGLIIKGSTQPVGQYVNVRLNVLYNDLVGFQKYCPENKRGCTELPQEVLSQNDVIIQTPLYQEVRAAQVKTANGDRIVVKFTVLPLVR